MKRNHFIRFVTGFTLFSTSVFADKVIEQWGGRDRGWGGWVSTGEFEPGALNLPDDPTPDKSGFRSTESGTGSVKSPVFTVKGDLLRFVTGGWDGLDWDEKNLKNRRNVYNLYDAETDKLIRQSQAPFKTACKTRYWYIGDLKGKQVYFEAVDAADEGYYAWIALGPVEEITKDISQDQSRFQALILPGEEGVPGGMYIENSGLPFSLPSGGTVFVENDTVRIEAGLKADRLYLLGMTSSLDQGCPVWRAPNDKTQRFFIGDKLGEIRINYADRTTDHYPLVLGENLWWGQRYYDFPEPFASDKEAKKLLDETLRLYPKEPRQDGQFIAVINTQSQKIESIDFIDSPDKQGVPVIAGISVKAEAGKRIANATPLPHNAIDEHLMTFAENQPLKPNLSESQIAKKVYALQQTLYTTVENFPQTVPMIVPEGYTGPVACFKGDKYAEVLTNIFNHNIHDMADKTDMDGIYHESSQDASSWGQYKGFGTFNKNVENYYNQAWSRGIGRALQELTFLGYLKRSKACAEWSFKLARVWEEQPHQIKGKTIPTHFCRVLQNPFADSYIPLVGCFENDGHGLMCVWLYQLWRRLPDPQKWAKDNWPDLKAAGDWILWQFENPEVFGTTDVLRTDSECAPGIGYSIYADFVCMDTLLALAKIAETIGQNERAEAWRERAALMKKGIENNYIFDDPKYGKTWTLKWAGWPNESTVLSPIMHIADYRGYLPEDRLEEWETINLNTYQRLVDTYKPFGYYGAAMGYGQGFVASSALLLDKMEHAEIMLQWLAKLVYNRHYNPYRVPEGAEVNADGTMWFRTGDLGNGFQQEANMKTFRIMLGIDDTDDETLKIVPRIPFGWTEISISNWPALAVCNGQRKIVDVGYIIKRQKDSKISMCVEFERPIDQLLLRVGPYKKKPKAKNVVLNGEQINVEIEKSSDAYWVRTKLINPEKIFTFQL